MSTFCLKGFQCCHVCLFVCLQFEDNRLWVNVSPLQRGVISVFDLSRDLGVRGFVEKSWGKRVC